MLKLLLPLIGIFLIYNFVSHKIGVIVLVLFLAAYVVIKLPEFYMLSGNSKYNKGDRKGGLALMEKAYRTGKLNSSMVIYYSYCLMRENNEEYAQEILDEYAASGKGTKADMCRAKHNKAIILRNMGKIREAFELMKEVHAELPATDTYGTLGLLYVDMFKKDGSILDEAIAFLEEAYEYNSDDRTIADNLGVAYITANRLDDAQEIFGKLVSAKPNSPTSYYHYGCLLAEKGDKENAEDMFNRALRYPFTGVTAIKRQDVEEALQKLDI